MASPYPFSVASLALANQGGGLGIMDDDYIFIKLDSFAVLLVVLEENFLRFAGEVVFTPVQGVMKSFRDFKKIVASSDYIPMGDDTQFDDQRNEAVKHLGNAATHSGRVHHFDALALQCFGQVAQFIEDRLPNNGLIVQKPWGRRRRRWCVINVDVRFPPLHARG